MTKQALINALLSARKQADFTKLDKYLAKNPREVKPIQVVQALEAYELARTAVE